MMNSFSNPHVYQNLLSWCKKAAQTNPNANTKPIDGEKYGQSGVDIYSQTVVKLEQGGQVEINLILPQASEAFEWCAEITLDDTSTQTYKHYLLRKAGDIVETYGKQVIPVSDNDAFTLLDTLQQKTGITA